ncbi:MAG: hypothetical protein A9Z00_07530 [Thermobacillus sp. ZCTH02-B1]|uniref:DUF423 domain-containing protein n=1 Tax=Thermobacillus sp. ZCTH02-B1 TaxID=1858795 RepID=UPI000B54FD07|nr:DUF423 domain-containing protein [Thermobacillus sp. ZCTH02-B1]OUM96172.1 MAG: hypothetical protein A9Z00_07530 [Thermobacillus sp. ZCTH02-B1]
MNWKRHAAAGAIYAGLAVALGAFGAHVLEERIAADAMSTWETAARYHMYHALGLILTALVSGRREADERLLAWALRLLQAGIWLFAGSLYVLVLTGAGWLGAVTPLGGVCWVTAWGLAAAALLRDRRQRFDGR